MKNYILTVIAVSALGSVVLGICPEGEGKGLKKTVSLIMSLLLIVSIGKPLISFILSFDSSDFVNGLNVSQGTSYEKVWQSSFENITEKSVEKAVEDLINNEFGLDYGDFEVECRLTKEENAFKIEGITVELLGAGVFKNPRRIEAFLYEKFMCECAVR